MRYFYTKFVVIESLIEELYSMDLEDGQKHHLAALVDSSLHHSILDEILSNLDEKDKKLFLEKLAENPEDEKILEFLKEKIDNIEDRIKKVSEDLILEMHKDIKKAKQLR